MKALQTDAKGTIEGFCTTQVDEPVAGMNQVKIAVKASGVNRADTLQRMGNYPPPPGTSHILGLEVAGEVVEIGAGVYDYKKGDRVMALLAGGGYAEYAVVNQGSVMPIPEKMNYTNAAGIPEVFLTSHQAMFLLGDLKKGETVLIHAGASGVGTAAIQLAREAGARILVTAGSDVKIDYCKELGADEGINYRTENNFDDLVQQYTNNKGADLIIDFIGADYISRNINAAGMDGRIVMLAFMGGAIANEVNLAKVLLKRITFMGSTLRSRSEAYKSNLTQSFRNRFLQLFEQGKIKPIIDSAYHWNEVGKAHQRIQQNLNIGKIILEPDVN